MPTVEDQGNHVQGRLADALATLGCARVTR